jgi:SAM-dependent methyltransferase
MRRWELRKTYPELPDGRDAYMVRVVGEWVESVMHGLVAQPNGRNRVVDVGCGEQPFRRMVEEHGGRYVGFDIEQNSQSSVDIIGFIDQKLPDPWPDADTTYDVVLCTEVLEHVAHLEVAFANLRALVASTGKVVITVPFVFPLHMEPMDYFRVTPYAIEAFAQKHGFVIDHYVKLGHPTDVIATILDDVSILPIESGLVSRLAVRVFRASRWAFLQLLQSPPARTLVRFNSNTYLSNGVILRPASSVGILDDKPKRG